MGLKKKWSYNCLHPTRVEDQGQGLRKKQDSVVNYLENIRMQLVVDFAFM